MDIERSSDEVEFLFDEETEDEDDDDIVEIENPMSSATPKASPARRKPGLSTDSPRDSLVDWVNLATDQMNIPPDTDLSTESSSNHDDSSMDELLESPHDEAKEKSADTDSRASSPEIEILPSPPSTNPSSTPKKRLRPRVPLPEATTDPKTFRQVLQLMVQQAVALDRRRNELMRVEQGHARDMRAKEEQLQKLNAHIASLKSEKDDAVRSAERARTEMSAMKVQVHQMQVQQQQQQRPSSRQSQAQVQVQLQGATSEKSIFLKDHESIVKRLETSHNSKLGHLESEKAELVFENARLKIELTQARTEASNMRYPEDVVAKLGERLRNEVHAGCLEVIEEVASAKQRVLSTQKQIDKVSDELKREKLISSQVPSLRALNMDLSKKLEAREKQLQSIVAQLASSKEALAVLKQQHEQEQEQRLQQQQQQQELEQQQQRLQQQQQELEQQQQQQQEVHELDLLVIQPEQQPQEQLPQEPIDRVIGSYLNVEIERLQGLNSILEERLMQATGETEDLRTKLALSENKYLDSMKEEADTRKALIESQSLLKSAEAEIQIMKLELSSLSTQLAEAQVVPEPSPEMTIALEKANEECASLQKTIEKLTEDHDSLKLALEKANEDHAASMQKALDEKTQVVEELQAVNKLQTQLQKELDESRENSSRHAKELETALNNIAKFKKELEDTLEVHANLLKENSDVREANEKLEATLNEATDYGSEIKKELDELHESHTTLQKNLDTARGDIASLNEDLVAARDEITALKQNLETSEMSKTALQKDLDSAISRRDELSQEIETSTLRLTDLENEINELKILNQEALSVNEQTSAKLNETESLRIKAETNLSEVRKERDELTLVKNTLEKELTDKKLEISQLTGSLAKAEAKLMKAAEKVDKMEAARKRVAATLANKHGAPIASPDRPYPAITTPTSSPPPSAGLLGSSQSGHRAKRKRMSTSLSHTSDFDLGEGSSSRPIELNDSMPSTPLIRSFSQPEPVPPLSQLHGNIHTQSNPKEPQHL